MNCGREIKLNKCLAEAEDSTVAFGKVGSVHTNRSDETCCSRGSVALPCGDGRLLFAPDVPFCEQALRLSGENKLQISFFFCLTKVANGQCVEIGMLIWGVRNGVREFVDLRKAGLSIPETYEEDVRWVRVARKSSRQL